MCMHMCTPQGWQVFATPVITAVITGNDRPGKNLTTRKKTWQILDFAI